MESFKKRNGPRARGFISVSWHHEDVKLRYVGCVIALKVSPKDLFPPIKEFLSESGYTEKAVCERLGLRNMEQALKLYPNPSAPHRINDRLDLAVRLFLIGELVEEEELQRWLPSGVMKSAAELELIARLPEKPGHWYATAALYPAYGLHVVSDRWANPEATPIKAQPEVVFPAITEYTTYFMEALPADPCEELLDLCSGTGIGALAAAANYAGHAWSLDITESCTRCAEFNRLLNGLDRKLTVARGDLYEPVAEQTFDRIVANPPYVPSVTKGAVFADGGRLGDQITRRVVEGLVKHLRPGGRFYCVAAGPERKNEQFEDRVRGWLGDASPQFDILVFQRRSFEPAYIAYQQAARSQAGEDELGKWEKVFEEVQVQNFFYGHVLIERKAKSGPPVTVRRRKAARFSGVEMEWLRRWETAAADPATASLILDSRPKTTGFTELHVTHRVHQGDLIPQEFRLETEYPFPMECRIDPWTSYLIPRCDGKTTVRELLAWLKENKLVEQAAPEGEFAELVRRLISGGFVELEGYPLPAV